MERKIMMHPRTYRRSSLVSEKGLRVMNRHTVATASTQATPACNVNTRPSHPKKVGSKYF